MANNSERFKNELERKLDEFKSAKDWPDFIGLAEQVIHIIKRYREDDIPIAVIPNLVKRLNQLLNQVLPGGVHLKVFECYHAVIDTLSKENFIGEFNTLTVGLFPFGSRCRISVCTEYINLLERITTVGGASLGTHCSSILVGLLPFLEAENSDFFSRVYEVLLNFQTAITEKVFFTGLWSNFIHYPDLRMSIINFVGKYKRVVIPDYGLVTTALCRGMISDNIFVIRFVLDISHRDFPLMNKNNEEMQMDVNDSFEIYGKPDNDININETGQDDKGVNNLSYMNEVDLKDGHSRLANIVDSLKNEHKINTPEHYMSGHINIDEMVSLKGTTPSETIDSSVISPTEVNELEKRVDNRIIDLAQEELDKIDDQIKHVLLEQLKAYNSCLLKHAVMIFLKKELSISKRICKWLGIDEGLSETDIHYVEVGLKQYLSPNVDEMNLLIKLLNSLCHKGAIITYLLEHVGYEAIEILNDLDKDNKDLLILKKNARIFASISHNELYRVFYWRLYSEFNNNNIINVEKTIKLIIYCIDTLGAIDITVTTIHIPLLCYLIIHNKSKPNQNLEYLIYLLNLVEVSDSESSLIDIDLINRFYSKDTQDNVDISQYDIVGSLGKALSNIEKFKYSSDEMIWAHSDLINNNGILEWTDTRNSYKLERKWIVNNINNETGLIDEEKKKAEDCLNNSHLPSNTVNRDIEGSTLSLSTKETESSSTTNFSLRSFIKTDSSIDNIGSSLSSDNSSVYSHKQIPSEAILHSNTHSKNEGVDGSVYHSSIHDCLKGEASENCSSYKHDHSSIKNTHAKSDNIPFIFSFEDVKLLYFFISKFGIKNFDQTFLKILAEYLTTHYLFVDLINILTYYIDYDALFINMWNDFILSKNSMYFHHFNSDAVFDFIVKILPTISLSDICLFLFPFLQNGMFVNIMFTVASSWDTSSNDFVNLLMNVTDTGPILKHISEKYYQIVVDESADPESAFNIIFPSLNIIKILLANKNFILALSAGYKIDLPRSGAITMIEVLVDILKSIILYGNKYETKNGYINSYLLTKSVTNDINSNDLSNNMNKMTIGSSYADYNKSNPKCHVNLANSNKVTDSLKSIRETFYILYELNRSQVDLSRLNETDLYEIIRDHKNDYVILKYSLFLFQNNIPFIFENYMRFYQSIFYDINEMPIKLDFFYYLFDSRTDCTVEMLYESFQYYSLVKGSKMDLLYTKCMNLMISECKKMCVVYSYSEGDVYKRIDLDNISSLGDKVVVDKYTSINNTEDVLVSTPMRYSTLTDDTILPSKLLQHIGMNETSLSPTVILYNGNLAYIQNLFDLLYSKSRSSFFNAIPDSLEFIFLFAGIKAKTEIFRRFLLKISSMRYQLRLLSIMAQLLTFEERCHIISLDSEVIRNLFVSTSLDLFSITFILQLFINHPQSDLSRMIQNNVLYSFENKIQHAIKHGADFDSELSAIEIFTHITINNTVTLNLFRSRISELCESNIFDIPAYSLFLKYFKSNPKCKLMIETFVLNFQRHPFTSSLHIKTDIFKIISSSNSFDAFSLINSYFSGMDSSFFMSAINEEFLRLNNIKKIAYLVMANPKNKFSTMSNQFIALINNNLNSNSKIKCEVLRLCVCLLLRVDHFFIQTLFPLLIGDFLSGSNFNNIGLCYEMIRFIDLSHWLESSIFKFEISSSFYDPIRAKVGNKLPCPVEYGKFDAIPTELSSIIIFEPSWDTIGMYLDNYEKYYAYIERYGIKKNNENIEYQIVDEFIVD